MISNEERYQQIGESLNDVVSSQMFGKPCLKTGGKAFVCFAQDEMVFKLPKAQVEQALLLPGAHLFDPSGKGRPMKEWVQIPAGSAGQWEHYAQLALDYVK